MDFEFFPHDSTLEIPKKYDPRVAPTVVALFEQYLDNKNDVILYLCDAADGRPDARQTLITRWHSQMGAAFEHHAVVVAVRQYEVYGGLLYAKGFLCPDILQLELVDKAPQILLDRFGPYPFK